ncbi:MAG: hypothetical protein IRZ08_04520 [Frankia sp.]|nr:hypothetical protein [Frankia sp.]
MDGTMRDGTPYRIEIRVEKFGDRARYECDESDEEVVVTRWFEPDGRPITDPARIAELESRAELTNRARKER